MVSAFSAVVPFKRLTLKVTCPPKATEVGGETKEREAGTVTAITGRVILLVADGLLATVAVIVTLVPMGITNGTVYMEATPSGVCAGTNVPQAPLETLPVTGLPPQVTVQLTPALALSSTGVMFTWTIDPAPREES
jgi:hypothetical protein